MWKRLKHGGDGLPYNYSEFLCETTSDLNDLPIKAQNEDGCCIGSKAYVFSNSKTYILDSSENWVAFSGVSGKVQGISLNGGAVVEPDENGVLRITVSGDGSTVIDSALSDSSTNPVQNKVVKAAISEVNTSLQVYCETSAEMLFNNTSASGSQSSYNYFYEIYTATETVCLSKISVKGTSGTTPVLALVRSVEETLTVVKTVTLNENTGSAVDTNISIVMQTGDVLYIGGVLGAALFVSSGSYTPKRISVASLSVGDTVTSDSMSGNAYFTVALYRNTTGLDSIRADMEDLADDVETATGGYDSELSRDYKFSTKVTSEGLIAVLDYPATGESESSETLDSIAWENLTYRDIFITNNQFASRGVDFESGAIPTGFTVYRGTPVVTSEASAAGSYSLKAFGSSAQQIYRRNVTLDFAANVPKYAFAKVRVDRYVSGNAGVYFDQMGDSGKLYASTVTDGFTTIAKQWVMTSASTRTNQLWFGSFSADLDAYVDELVVVDGSIFTSYPTEEEMTALYETYIALLNSGSREMTVELLIPTEPAEGEYTDAECTAAFLSAMNAKASELGMSGTYYASASGLTTSSLCTPQDEMKLGLAVCANPIALGIWSTPDRSFTVGSRTVSVTNNVISGSATDLGTYYKLLGGKGGSMNANIRAQVLLVEIDGLPAMLGLMAADATGYTNIYKSAKELADMLKAQKDGGTPTEGENLTALVSGGGGYAGCFVPDVPGAYLKIYSAADMVARTGTISNTPTASCVPASTSKVMTMLVALDYLTDLHATFAVKSADIETGSGSAFSAGETVRAIDALCIMMMESSNTMAQCIGRNIGQMILDRAVS